VSGTDVSVRWDNGKTSTQKFGFEENGEKRYEVYLVEEGKGGALYVKGAVGVLEDAQLETPWSFFGLELLDDATLLFSAISGEDMWFRLSGNKRIYGNKWTHICYVQDKSKCRIYIDGCLDVEGVLDGHMLHPGSGSKTSQIIESPHPYNHNMDTYWVVEVEGATSYTVTFDPQTKTERNYDYVRIYKDDSHNEYWGDEKYTGNKEPCYAVK
jgi:hypothetical protein